MKKHLFYTMSLLLISLIFSCQEDPVDNPYPSSPVDQSFKKFSLQEAKAYFEANATDLSPLIFGENPYPKVKGISVQNLVPEWEKGMESGHEGVKLVEIPLYSGLVALSMEKVIKSGKLAYTKHTFVARRLVIAKTSKGIIEMFVATIIPSVTADGNLMKSLENFRYLGGGDFTGRVFASRLDGTFFKAFQYEKGENKGKIGIVLKSEVQDSSELKGDYSTITLMDMTGRGSENPEEECPHNVPADDCKICLPEVLVTACTLCMTPNGCTCVPCFKCGRLPKDCRCGKEPEICNVCHMYPCGCAQYDPNKGGSGGGGGNNSGGDKEWNDNQPPSCNICGMYPCVCVTSCSYCGFYPCRCCSGETCTYCGGLINAKNPKCKACNCRFEIKISAPRDNQILKPYDIKVTIKPSASLMSSYRLKIRRTTDTQEETLYDGMSLTYTRNSHASGFYEIYATVIYQGTEYKSNVITVEEKYPSIDDIVADPEVSSVLAEYWARTKSFASTAGRKEFGCWIYLNTSTGKYVCEEVPNDNVVVGCVGTKADIAPGSPRGQAGMGPLDQNAYEYVAFFHTHTPLTYCPEGQRKTGPSLTDYELLNKYKIPGALYDYRAVDLIGGHPLNDPAHLKTFGDKHRATQLFGKSRLNMLAYENFID